MCDSYASPKFSCVEVVKDQEAHLVGTHVACFPSKVSANNLGSQCDSG